MIAGPISKPVDGTCRRANQVLARRRPVNHPDLSILLSHIGYAGYAAKFSSDCLPNIRLEWILADQLHD
jgi:hypothetical protein